MKVNIVELKIDGLERNTIDRIEVRALIKVPSYPHECCDEYLENLKPSERAHETEKFKQAVQKYEEEIKEINNLSLGKAEIRQEKLCHTETVKAPARSTG